MKHVLIFFGVIGAMIVYSVIRHRMNPPREMSWPEVPDEVRAAVESSLQGLAVESVWYAPVEREYHLVGTFRERSVQIEVECSPSDRIQEVEFEDLDGSRNLLRKTKIEYGDIPEKVIETLRGVLGADVESFAPSSAMTGTIQDQAGYEIKGKSDEWVWEVEIAEDGRLVEFEKDAPFQRSKKR